MSELIGDNPVFPTPWRARRGADVFDADDNHIFEIVSDHADSAWDEELAREIVRVMNEKFSDDSDALRVFSWEWMEPPRDVHKLRSSTGIVIERHSGGGWHTVKLSDGSDVGLYRNAQGWFWSQRHSILRFEDFPLTEVRDS